MMHFYASEKLEKKEVFYETKLILNNVSRFAFKEYKDDGKLAEELEDDPDGSEFSEDE